MKALILGAGYGTRLRKGFDKLDPGLKERYRPAIEGRPKALVLVAGKPLIEYLLEKIETETEIKDVYIITNQHFYDKFNSWQQDYSSSLSVKIFNDGTLTNEDRLGPMGDIGFVLAEEKVDDDLLILAGDTLFEMDFGGLTDYFKQKGRDVISVYYENSDSLHKRGIVTCDLSGKIIDFLEKPENPPSNLAAPMAYILTKETLQRVPGFLENDYDREENLIQKLVSSGQSEIYTFLFEKRYDIGSIDDFIRVDEEFSRRFK